MKLTDRVEYTEVPAVDDLIHIVVVNDPTDSPEGTSFKIPLSLLKRRLHGVGFFDYNDLATQTTPIAVTQATSPVKLTNDEAGSFTLKTFAPADITDIWDSITDEFDFSELALGDMIDIRLDLEVTTTQPNQEVTVDLRLAVGGGEYTIPFIHDSFKTAETHKLVKFNGIYMGNTDTHENPAYFEVSSDDDCTVKVNGWYCKIVRQ